MNHRRWSPVALENFMKRKQNMHLSNYQVSNMWYESPEMVEMVEREFGPGEPILANPNQSSVQIGSATAEARARARPPVQSLIKDAEFRFSAANMEFEQREMMTKSGEVRP